MAGHIYAEHLINIRTLTIQVSLSTPSGQDTTITVNGDVLSLSHQGQTTSVTLPVSLPAGDEPKLSIPPVPSTDLSFRVRLPDTGSPQDNASSETVIPWTAASLSSRAELQCKTCAAVILPGGKIQTWKDLPSEGWAEMMEFWHCHKPNEPHNHGQQTDKKGYSADSTLAITSSVGLVNATSFILAAEDCNNIKMQDTLLSQHTTTSLTCSSCNVTLGFWDSTTESYKLAKLALSASLNTNSRQSFSSAKWLSCHLLSSMDNQGLRRFVVTSEPGSNESLSIWIFTPDLNIASSASPNDTPLRASKLLWKLAPTQAHNALLDKQSMTEGEIEMPAIELEALKRSLEDSAVLLSQTSRRFQDWNVALLERFSVEDGNLL